MGLPALAFSEPLSSGALGAAEEDAKFLRVALLCLDASSSA